jgi:hypothetical protein
LQAIFQQILALLSRGSRAADNQESESEKTGDERKLGTLHIASDGLIKFSLPPAEGAGIGETFNICQIFAVGSIENSVMIKKILSGGQTGADRAAWDAALSLGVPCGGWVPRGCLAEDGVIPARYPGQRQTAGAEVSERTRRNVRDADATLILFHAHLGGDSQRTLEFARELARPCLSLDLQGFETPEGAVAKIRGWLAGLDRLPLTLNVAGPRAGEDPAIYAATRQIVRLLFTPA